MAPDTVLLFGIILVNVINTNSSAYEMPLVRLTPGVHRILTSYSNTVTPLKNPPLYTKIPKNCFVSNNWINCSIVPVNGALNNLPKIGTRNGGIVLQQLHRGPYSIFNTKPGIYPESNSYLPVDTLTYTRRPMGKLNGLPSNINSLKNNFISLPKNNLNRNVNIGKPLKIPDFNPLHNTTDSRIGDSRSASENVNSYSNVHEIELTTESLPVTETEQASTHEQKDISIFDYFTRALDRLERNFYATTFFKLISITPAERLENGMSFVQSGIFLQLALLAFSTEPDSLIRAEIDECLGLQTSNTDKIQMIEQILSYLPTSSDDLKFRWSSRLALWPGADVTREFREGAASALHLQLEKFNGTETPDVIADTLNRMVEIDSGGAIRDTFQEDELSKGIQAVFLTTLYMRGLWRSAPTVLNGSQPFRDDAPPRSVRMIRINDIMRYADLPEWDAEAVEIFYATQGLSLLILVPRGLSLRSLADRVASTSLEGITQRMHTLRVAATLPLYTLRMTLLLPNKLQDMGVSRLVDVNTTDSGSLRLSHAVQRIMFWAEAGRNAFKDDGMEWDDPPELELIVDRPYIFFVRWHELTIMNGNFVL